MRSRVLVEWWDEDGGRHLREEESQGAGVGLLASDLACVLDGVPDGLEILCHAIMCRIELDFPGHEPPPPIEALFQAVAEYFNSQQVKRLQRNTPP